MRRSRISTESKSVSLPTKVTSHYIRLIRVPIDISSGGCTVRELYLRIYEFINQGTSNCIVNADPTFIGPRVNVSLTSVRWRKS